MRTFVVAAADFSSRLDIFAVGLDMQRFVAVGRGCEVNVRGGFVEMIA